MSTQPDPKTRRLLQCAIDVLARALVRARLEAPRARLQQWTDAPRMAPLRVRGGAFDFAVAASAGRALVAVASHAIHHVAVLQPRGQQLGIANNAEFGRAPATVASEPAALPASPPPSMKDIPCLA